MKPFNLIKDIIEKRGAIEEVYWVACGGSLIDKSDRSHVVL